MDEKVYDIAIGEVAKILNKSDRQVRRYVKEQRLNAKPVRVDGHVKLMFNKEEVERFKDNLNPDGILSEVESQVSVEAELVGDDENEDAPENTESEDASADVSGGVKYVIDALREQLDALRSENRDLHYQLEQRSGQVGFLQGKIEALQEEMKMLAPVNKPEDPIPDKKPWYRRLFGG